MSLSQSFSSLKIEEQKSSSNPNNSTFVFHHLPLGTGTTLGNYFRRNVISSLDGVAPIGVKIADQQGFVKSKFSSLVGCTDSTPYLIINLKDLILSPKKEITSDQIINLHLSINNDQDQERVVTAKDFQANEYLKIENPDLYLTTLAPQAKLEIILSCKKDFGYHRDNDWEKLLEEGTISLDSDHSPVRGKNVAFSIDQVISNLAHEEDRLKLVLETNGSLTPQQALLATIDNSLEIFNSIKSLVANLTE